MCVIADNQPTLFGKLLTEQLLSGQSLHGQLLPSQLLPGLGWLPQAQVLV
jgi:hypothetical protein